MSSVAAAAALGYLTRGQQPGDAAGGTAQPIPSDIVNQSYGEQVFPHFRGSVYSNYSAVEALLVQLEVRWTRSQFPVAMSEALQFHRNMYIRHGIQLNAGMGAFPRTASERVAMPALRDRMAAEARKLPAMFKRFEGYNEPQGTRFGPVPSWWVDETITHQRWLYGLGHELGIEVASPALHDQVPTLPDDYRKLGAKGMGGLCDVIALHRYPAGVSPSNGIDQRTQLATTAYGFHPIVCTEGGYFTAPHYTGGAKPVTEAVQAVYAPRHLMEWVLRGGQFNHFELLDDPDPSDGNREAHLGHVAVGTVSPSTWRPKPAFDEMRKLLAATSDPGPTFVPQPISLTVQATPDLRWLVTAKRDGSMRLWLWRDVDVYDPTTRTPINVTPVSVTYTDKFGPQKVSVAGSLVSAPVNETLGGC